MVIRNFSRLGNLIFALSLFSHSSITKLNNFLLSLNQSIEENDGRRRPPCLLLERIFAVGEEPAGVRVTPYHKACAIRQILDVLDPDEVEHIRVSPFGKLVEIADKPSFSRRFGRYIISRQLKVAKKHEAWFLFAGKPIRFSIREFALVTG